MARRKITLGWRIYVDATDHDGTQVRLPVGIGDTLRCEATIWKDPRLGAVYTTRRAAKQVHAALVKRTGRNASALNIRLRRIVRWV